VQKARPDLRVVISSATLEAGALASYFDARTDRRKEAAVPVGDVSRAPALLSVEGRTHDVKVGRLDGSAALLACVLPDGVQRSCCLHKLAHVVGLPFF
jgi:ATP-dependent RNA helicase DDX35